MQAINTSYDRAVLSMDGNLDPIEELLRGNRNQVVDICRLLIMSWEDVDLPDRGAIPTRGLLHVFWRTHMNAAQRMVLGRHSAWHHTPPPVLLMRQRLSPAFVEELPCNAFKLWSGILLACHMRRHKTNHILVWEPSNEAKALWAAFHAEILNDPELFAPFPSVWFRWIPELMMRLALLLSVLNRFTYTQPPEKGIVEADAVNKACILARWLAHEHIESLKTLRSNAPVNGESGDDDFCSIDTIDDQAVGAAVLEKLRRKGAMSPRNLTRSFHKLHARHRERVVSRLIKECLVRQSDDETIHLTSTPNEIASRADSVSVSTKDRLAESLDSPI